MEDEESTTPFLTQHPSYPTLYIPRRTLLATLLYIANVTRAPLLAILILPMSDEFGWDAPTQGWLHASFFFGFVGSQLLGGALADLYDGRTVAWAGFSILALTLLAVPVCCLLDNPPALNPVSNLPHTHAPNLPIFLILNRLVMGFGEGVIDPATFNLIAHWFPISERNRAVAFVFNGSCITATALAYLLVPLVSQAVGWRLVWVRKTVKLVGFTMIYNYK